MDEAPQLVPLTPPPSDTEHTRIELLKKLISGWVRQSRFRARKSGVEVDVSFGEILEVYEAYKYLCAYCGAQAASPDHPFPIKEKGPCVQANIVPCCDLCRSKKKNHNVVKFYQEGHISEQQLHSLIKEFVKRNGGQQLKEYIRSVYIPASPASPDPPTSGPPAIGS